jgi:tRNA(fMet)-specific endonuclease VapC
MCPISRGEIRYGIERIPKGTRRQVLETKAANVFASTPCIVIPQSAGDHYAITRFKQEQRGITLNDNDSWIAATALAIGAVLVTRDKDFEGIDGLTSEDWTIGI